MGFDLRTEEQEQLLSDPDNVAILHVLEATAEPLGVRELAVKLLERDVDVVRTAEFERQIEERRTTLHHRCLPKLSDAGLLEYDPETNRVQSGGPSTPAVEWTDEASIAAVADSMPTGDDEDSPIGTISGRESVLQYGRTLADRAESELFCLYVSEELLKDECVRRCRDAIERGVTMYLGSHDPNVRQLASDRLPEATVWEPQYDWLNDRSSASVGRLVLADRRRVMLAVVDEPADGTDPEETAIVGEGEDHPLVVLVRDLLGPRLDHLDFQSSDFRSQLPS